MVLVKKNETFPSFYFWRKKKTASKMCLTKERKKAFLETTIRKLKTSKNPKGLVCGFGQKFEIFPCFYFCQNQTGKCV